MITLVTSKATARKLRIAEATNYYIQRLIAENQEAWSQDTEALLAELNANPQESLELIAGSIAVAQAVNATQDSLNVRDEAGQPVYTARAPVASPRPDITFNGTEFVCLPAAE